MVFSVFSLHQELIRNQKTAAGIFLPQSATSNPLPEATVIAVGPGAPNKDGTIIPTTVKAGDRVLLPGWGGNSIKVGEDVRVFLVSGLCSGMTDDVATYIRNTSYSRIRTSSRRLKSKFTAHHSPRAAWRRG